MFYHWGSTAAARRSRSPWHLWERQKKKGRQSGAQKQEEMGVQQAGTYRHTVRWAFGVCTYIITNVSNNVRWQRNPLFFFFYLPPVNDIIDLTCKVILQVNLSHVNTVALHCCVLLIWIQVAEGAVWAERSTDFPHPGNIWGDNSS